MRLDVVRLIFLSGSMHKLELRIVNQFKKIVFVWALLIAVFSVTVEAQPVTARTNQVVAVTSAASAQVEKEAKAEVLVPQVAPVLFHVGPLPVTNAMVCSWDRDGADYFDCPADDLEDERSAPDGQNLMEALIEGWEGLMGNVLEPKVVKWVFPFAMSFFIFIVISNLTDLLPGVGSIGMGHPDKTSAMPFALEHVTRPFFRPPTTDVNLTVAMAGIFFVMCLYWAVKYNGPLGVIKHVFGVKVDSNKWLYPLLLLLFIFIGVMESFSILFIRPVALALRLYGNIFGGETMLTMALSQKPWCSACWWRCPDTFLKWWSACCRRLCSPCWWSRLSAPCVRMRMRNTAIDF